MFEAGLGEKIFQLAAGIDAVFEGEASGAAVFYQGPVGGNAAPVVAELRALDEKRAIGQVGADCVLPGSGEAFFAHNFDDEHAGIFEVLVEILQYLKIIALIGEVSEGSIEIAGEIECRRAMEETHVLLDPFHRDVGLGCPLARLA